MVHSSSRIWVNNSAILAPFSVRACIFARLRPGRTVIRPASTRRLRAFTNVGPDMISSNSRKVRSPSLKKRRALNTPTCSRVSSRSKSVDNSPDIPIGQWVLFNKLSIYYLQRIAYSIILIECGSIIAHCPT